MIVTKKVLPRRMFLRGTGVALALPLLDAMVPALSALSKTAANPVRRLGFVYIPMGMNAAEWTPAAEGKLVELSPSLSSLMPSLDHVTVLTNLELENANAPTNANHATSNSTFLSGVRAKPTEGTDYYLGTTADQIAARHISKDSPIPSLELGTDLVTVAGQCDNGFNCAYQHSLAWSSPTTPLRPEADPRVVFERLFGDGGTTADRRAELKKNSSILDWVTERIGGLERKLGASDKNRVDGYLNAIREVERRIQKTEQQMAESPLPTLDRPASIPAEWEDHVKLMCDLQVLALQADLTRVITFQIARESSTRSYPQIGVPDSHHPVSHHRWKTDNLAKLAKINAYHVSLFAYLVDALKSTQDGDGTLLDHSMYLLGSGMGNPDAHTHTILPIVVAGGEASGGRHIRYAEPTPMTNLLLTMLDKAGVHLDSFADSTGRVAGLREPLSL